MNIRYFFIAGAITSGLALAIQKSDRIVNQAPSPIVAPYTVEKTHSQFFKQVSSPSDTLNILRTANRTASEQASIDDIYEKGKNLLNAIASFLGSLVIYFLQIISAKV
ncbi:hypothetical protein MCU_01431 [Bartonella elizabethae Re6043vi]|uniref:Uncharacterized protein n=2 Tax=Bartonella elizabethae TaxID=807 RepID=J1K775_BAREL|nr:hypothetical protein [Bartonella elizabethae]EJF82508.1 hypothetical protein MCU_01431 [Bartonella elizabethae Re6043vi]EJF93492.1 hypothetical protein MEE_01470 [Bartonella elizabethae F9251 = ATCC 49927]VEJ41867.1 Uncharacterised protein [Bartonella elizabethae]